MAQATISARVDSTDKIAFDSFAMMQASVLLLQLICLLKRFFVNTVFLFQLTMIHSIQKEI